MLRQKLDECQAKISDLGTLPVTELITKYMSYSSKNVSIYFYTVININILIYYSMFSCSKNLKKPTVILNATLTLTKKLWTNL